MAPCAKKAAGKRELQSRPRSQPAVLDARPPSGREELDAELDAHGDGLALKMLSQGRFRSSSL